MDIRTVHDVIQKIDLLALKKRLGVSDRAIRLAKENEYFAANWYAVVKDLCGDAGISCPLCLFNFKGTSPIATKYGNFAKLQPQGTKQSVSPSKGAA